MTHVAAGYAEVLGHQTSEAATSQGIHGLGGVLGQDLIS